VVAHAPALANPPPEPEDAGLDRLELVGVRTLAHQPLLVAIGIMELVGQGLDRRIRALALGYRGAPCLWGVAARGSLPR